MPRSGAGVYSKANAAVAPNTTIASAEYNSTIDDLVADANTPRPLSAGGTAGTSAASARSSLGVAEAASSVTDTTAGRGLIMGSLGWGGESVPLPDTDLDGIGNVTGVYSTIAGSTTNTPEDVNGTLLSMARDAADRLSQTFWATGTNRQWVRQQVGAASWTDWQQLITVAEKATNANGAYTLFSDGTLRCRKQHLTLEYYTADLLRGTWTFPRAFSTTDYLTVVANLLGGADISDGTTPGGDTAAVSGGEMGNVTVQPITLTTCGVYLFRIAGSSSFIAGDQAYVSLIAEGTGS